ncbi:hypothetical protein TERTU_1688 [Teredinibacter turnerae T7901]|uniref:Uncharacterized protein n=1 Tax=Teredinibacter turnerae (strain ATCC 39867 / T7901) TaxID=377629 RepID=C5BU31_TERTT|nr:hypothetical protein TERTU_1688 [Teredinibacter turnerae T7901]
MGGNGVGVIVGVGAIVGVGVTDGATVGVGVTDGTSVGVGVTDGATVGVGDTDGTEMGVDESLLPPHAPSTAESPTKTLVLTNIKKPRMEARGSSISIFFVLEVYVSKN